MKSKVKVLKLENEDLEEIIKDKLRVTSENVEILINEVELDEEGIVIIHYRKEIVEDI